MAWTPKIKAVEKIQGQLHVVIAYSDGTRTFNEDLFLSTPRTLNDVVFKRIAELDALDTYATSLVVGTSISTTPTVVTPPTQAEIDREAWLVNYRKLFKAKQTLVDVGVIPASNSTYAALLSTVQAGLQASYLDYI